MIDKITYTKEHLLSLVKKYKTDPQLLERTVFVKTYKLLNLSKK